MKVINYAVAQFSFCKHHSRILLFINVPNLAKPNLNLT